MTSTTARPLFRWKLFWFGIFTFCFLGWAWWDSCHATIYAEWSGKRALQVYRFDGASILISGAPTNLAAVGPRWIIGRDAATRPLGLEHYLEGRIAYGVRYWKLPDALIFYPLLGLFLGGLAWRRRRHLRLGAEKK